MDQRELEELLPFYALDALTDEERQAVESYLAVHPESRLQLEEMIRAASSIPQGVSPVEPPRRIKDALMRRVRAGERASAAGADQPSRRVMRLGNIFQAFSMGVATVAIVWAVILNSQLAQLQS